MSKGKFLKTGWGRTLFASVLVLAGASIGMRSGGQLVSVNPMAVDPACDMPADTGAPHSATLGAGDTGNVNTGARLQLVSLNETQQENGQPLLAQAVQEHLAQGHAQASSEEGESPLKIKPDLFIKDPYADFSAVFVDNTHDEVVLADENNFNIMTFKRTENTPASAEMSKPIRSIGGDNTDIEYQSALYVDPVNGDIYATNNDTKEKLGVFSRGQEGDVFASRELATPYGAFGIAVDEQHQEMLLTVQHAGAVVTFTKDAAGHAAPIRLLQGNDTQLADPHGIALDPKTDEIYTSNWGAKHKIDPSLKPFTSRGRPSASFPSWPLSIWTEGKNYTVPGTGSFQPPSINVYARTATGNAAPTRMISGPKTQLDWPTNISYDPDRGELFVANDMGNSILVFNNKQQGDVAPIRVLRGPKTLLKNPTGVFADVKHGELWVANYGGHTATVYKLSASGDATPIRVIRTAPKGVGVPEISNSNSLGFDSKREQIIAPSCVHHPEISMFDCMATGGVSPLRQIAGEATHLDRTVHGVAYDPIHDEIFVPHNIAQAIMVYRGDANGEEAPIRIIQGPHTQLIAPQFIAEDPVNNEIYIPEAGRILVYPRDGQGDIAPIRILAGPNTGLGEGDVDIDPIHNVLVASGGGLRIFDRTAQGDAKPLRVINAGGYHMRVYPEKGEIFATVGLGGGRDTALPPGAPSWYWKSGQALSTKSYVGVWSINDSGNAPPRFRIGGPDGVLQAIHGIAIDPQHKAVLISDKWLDGLLTYYYPDAF